MVRSGVDVAFDGPLSLVISGRRIPLVRMCHPLDRRYVSLANITWSAFMSLPFAEEGSWYFDTLALRHCVGVEVL